VDINAPGPAHDGTSWAAAFTDLQQALSAAAANDRILVADGTYKPTSGTDRTISFELKNGVGLYGGYAGHGAVDPDVRDPVLYPSILSGDIGVAGDKSDNSYHVLSSTGLTSRAVVDGFTITGGNADGTFPYNCGGGMYNSSSSPTLINCTFTGNSATGTYGGGGGMYNSSSSPTLTNCTFSGNSASDGGGMYDHWYSSPTVTNCTFHGNSADYDGGGMYSEYSCSPTLSNCIVWGNVTPSGSQIHDDPGSMSAITNSDVEGGYTGTGNLNADPLFVRSPSPGADGVWGTADDDYGDLRLQPNSPCIDAGNNAALPADTLDLDRDGDTAEPIPFDLAGGPRRWDFPAVPDTGNGTAPVVDLGAYEATGLIVQGTSAADHLYLRLDPGGATVQMWLNADPSGRPRTSRRWTRPAPSASPAAGPTTRSPSTPPTAIPCPPPASSSMALAPAGSVCSARAAPTT
jgi:hypothetical protein